MAAGDKCSLLAENKERKTMERGRDAYEWRIRAN